MNYLFYYLVFGISTLLVGYVVTDGIIQYEGDAIMVQTNELPNRRNITFILGEDNPGRNYFALASEHFAMDEKERTDYVVSTCRTLKQVIEFLNFSNSRGCAPWSIINIVAHGNPNTGLNLYISDSGYKATPKRLLQAALTRSLPKINEGIVDKQSQINFWSCGIGKSPLINISLRQLFTPQGEDTTNVYCSPNFVIFHPSNYGDPPRRIMASYWPYYYKRGYRPSASIIAHEMKKQYPEEAYPWRKALNVTNRENGDSYHQDYHIPVSFTKIYPTKMDRPNVETEKEKEDWISSQAEIVNQIEESGIPRNKFNWQVNKIIHTLEDGTKVPAIKAIGMSTVLMFLRES